MSTTEVGIAYVRLLPSMDGFAAEVRRELGDALTRPAREAGEDAGRAIARGIEDGVADADVDGITSGIGDKLKLGLATAGLAGGALLMEGLSSALDLGATTDKLAAQLGQGNLWAESAGEIAGQLYKEGFGESVAETGDAVKRIIQAGLSPELTDEALEGITRKFLTFTDVLDQDMDMTVQSVQSMFNSGIVGSAEEALDVLTATIQAGGDKAGDLAETFQEYSTSFREAGLSAADAAGLMVQGLNAGARDADKVADALKEWGIRAKDGSDTTRQAFTDLGLDAETAMLSVAAGGDSAALALQYTLEALREMEDPVARNAAAVALFGTQAEDLGDALFALDLETAADNLGTFAGSTDELGSAYDNAASKIEAFKRGALMALTEFVGNEVIPRLESLAEVVGPILSAGWEDLQELFDDVRIGYQAFVDAWNDPDAAAADGWLGTVEEVATTLRQAFEDAQPAIDTFLDAWKDLTSWIEDHGDVTIGIIAALAVAVGVGLAAAFWSLAASVIAATWPFLLAAGAIAAVAGALIWAYENVDEFRAFVDEVLPKVADLFRTTFDLIVAAIDASVTAAKVTWELFGNEIVAVATIAWNLVTGVISGALDIITGILDLAVGVLTGDWGRAWDGIVAIATGSMQIVTSIVSAGVGLVMAIWSAAWSVVSLIFRGAWDGIKSEARAGLDSIVDFFKRLPGRLASALSSLASMLTAPFRAAFNNIRSAWNSTLGGFRVSIPGFLGFGGVSFSIPRMHTGGIFEPGSGEEGLALLKRGEGVFTREQMAAIGTGVASSGPAQPVTVVIEADERRFKEWLRYTVRVDGGGDVQAALGRVA